MSPTTVTWDDYPGEGEAPLMDLGEVRARLSALDGRHKTLVMIEVGDAHLACGGDSTTGLVLYMSPGGDGSFQLMNGTATDTVIVVAGGQPGRYAARFVVPLEMAVAAAEYFAIHGARSPHLTWDEQ